MRRRQYVVVCRHISRLAALLQGSQQVMRPGVRQLKGKDMSCMRASKVIVGVPGEVLSFLTRPPQQRELC